MFPLELEADVRGFANVTLEGPNWRGITLLQVDASDPQHRYYHAFRWERHQFASAVQTNRLTGESSMTCMDVNVSAPCPLFGESVAPSTATMNNPERPFFAGKSFLILDAEFSGLLNLTIHFDQPILRGPSQQVAFDAERIAPELFEVDYAEMHRCGYVAWCGVLLGGRITIDLQGADLGFLNLQGHSDSGALMAACLQQDDLPNAEDCVDVFPGAGSNAHYESFVLQGGSARDLTLEAAGPPIQDVAPGTNTFYFGGRFLRLALPEHSL